MPQKKTKEKKTCVLENILEYSPRNQNLDFILYTYTCIYLNKNLNVYWSKQSFTSVGPDDRC